MDLKDRKVVDDAIREYGDDFWNDEPNFGAPYINREGLIEDLIAMLKQAGYKLVVKPL